MLPVDETELHEMQEMSMEDMLSRCVEDTAKYEEQQKKEKKSKRRADAEAPSASQSDECALEHLAVDQY